MTDTQKRYIAATCGQSKIVFVSDDNATFGVETNGRTEYMPIMRVNKKGTWEISKESKKLEPITLNGHHGVRGYQLVTRPVIDNFEVTNVEPDRHMESYIEHQERQLWRD